MPSYNDAIEHLRERAAFHKREAELWDRTDFPEEAQPYADRQVIEHNACANELVGMIQYLERQR